MFPLSYLHFLCYVLCWDLYIWYYFIFLFLVLSAIFCQLKYLRCSSGILVCRVECMVQKIIP